MKTRFEVSFYTSPRFAFRSRGMAESSPTGGIYYKSDSNVSPLLGRNQPHSVYAHQKIFNLGGLHFRTTVLLVGTDQSCTRSLFERLPFVLLQFTRLVLFDIFSQITVWTVAIMATR